MTKVKAASSSSSISLSDTSNSTNSQIETSSNSERPKAAEFSRPLITKEILLHSNQVQMVLKYCFEQADVSLYYATKIVRNQSRDAVAEVAEKKLLPLFDEFSRELSETVLQLENAVNNQVEEGSRNIQFDHAQTFSVGVHTGLSSRLLNLTQQLDRLVALVETLEINNVLSTAESIKTIKSWCNRYRRFCQEINRVKFGAMKKE